jgi:hypothetical protein
MTRRDSVPIERVKGVVWGPWGVSDIQILGEVFFSGSRNKLQNFEFTFLGIEHA